MASRILDLLSGVSGYVAAAAVLIIVVKLSRPSKLDAIPTVGSSGWLGSWRAGFKFSTNALDVIREGYKKHKSAPFKVAASHRWIVILSSRKHVEEIWRAHDDELSFTEVINDRMQLEYTMGPNSYHNPYQVPIIRSRLTRNIAVMFPEMMDEISAAFNDVLDLKDDEWKSVPMLSSMRKVACRVSNRAFVGLPLCRDPGWIDLNIRFTMNFVKETDFLAWFPGLLKIVAARFLTNAKKSTQYGKKFLDPIIKERCKSLSSEHGNGWGDTPNDFLSWLMEKAEGPELTVESLTTRLISVNFASIHPTSNTFTLVLFNLAANPQYIQPLREEVEAIVQKEGWSKAAVDKMSKVDSFLRESHRVEGTAGVGLQRKLLKDHTFSDGTFVPKGTLINTPIECIHFDEDFYSNAHAFEPFRFVDLNREKSEGAKYRFASTSTSYLSFGHGRHACPGRFFVANELKSMLAHIVVNYDVKLEDNTTRPQRLRLETLFAPDPNAKVMFRRRTY